MICEYENIDNILFIRFPETISGNDLRQYAIELDDIEKDYTVVPNRLVDLRRTKSFNFMFDSALNLAEHRMGNKYANAFRLGLLVANTYQMGFARMYQTFCTSKMIEVKIFDEEQKAIDWINLSKTA